MNSMQDIYNFTIKVMLVFKNKLILCLNRIEYNPVKIECQYDEYMQDLFKEYMENKIWSVPLPSPVGEGGDRVQFSTFVFEN